MKFFIVFALLVAAAVAAPAGSDGDAVVLRSDNNIGADGYHYSFETSNGIQQQQEGKLVNAGSENESLAVRGSFAYPGPDGKLYQVQYTADENGFHPQGAHF